MSINKKTNIYTKVEIERALVVIKEEKYNNINNETNEIQQIVKHIVTFSKKFNIDIQKENLKQRLLLELKSSGNYTYLGIATKIEEILNGTDTVNEVLWINRLLDSPNFIPYYQGIRNNETGEINKYEALVRYMDGDIPISPFEFIEIAEKNNLLGVIAKKMITQVIEEMTIHKYDVSINLDGELLEDTTIELIFNTLEKYKIAPERLTIEVLETIKTGKNHKKISENVNKLKSKGIYISLDDIGSGYSNLNRIIDIYHDNLKIDGYIIQQLEKAIEEKNGENIKKVERIIKAIIDIAHDEGKTITAEHIEKLETQEYLVNLGVDFSQGYYYSKPSRSIITLNLEI